MQRSLWKLFYPQRFADSSVQVIFLSCKTFIWSSQDKSQDKIPQYLFSCIRNITNVGICASHWITSSSCLIWLQSRWQEKACLDKWAVDTWIVHVSGKWAMEMFMSRRSEQWIHSNLREVSSGYIQVSEKWAVDTFMSWRSEWWIHSCLKRAVDTFKSQTSEQWIRSCKESAHDCTFP